MNTTSKVPDQRIGNYVIGQLDWSSQTAIWHLNRGRLGDALRIIATRDEAVAWAARKA